MLCFPLSPLQSQPCCAGALRLYDKCVKDKAQRPDPASGATSSSPLVLAQGLEWTHMLGLGHALHSAPTPGHASPDPHLHAGCNSHSGQFADDPTLISPRWALCAA